MTAARWRGTLIYTGTLATIGTVALVRFGPLAQEALPQAAAVPSTAGTATGGTTTGGSTTDGTTSDGTTSDGTTAGGTTASPADPTTPATGSTASDSVTVVGSVAQTRYGPVQVQVTFTGSQIVDVQTLQSPSSHRESERISARSTPVLAQEVLSAQSASIDTVSGATYTSEGYRESVQSAIDQVG